MTASVHAVIGAAIVAKIPDLRLAIPLILLSHILGDLPNHWDTGTGWTNKKITRVLRDTVADELIGLFIVFLVFILWLNQNPVQILIGVFTSQLFDYIEVPYFFLGWKSAPWSWINTFTHLFHKKLPQIYLTATHQIILIAIIIAFVALTR